MELTTISGEQERYVTLLRASHIKPWVDCENNQECLDVFNGLLLAPHLDALFDGGWITFDDVGRLVKSYLLDDAAVHRWPWVVKCNSVILQQIIARTLSTIGSIFSKLPNVRRIECSI